MQKMIVVAISALVALALLASVASSCATQRQAQATVEVARVAQIASAGQSAASLAIVILVILLVLVVLAAAVTVGVLTIQKNRIQAQLSGAGPSGWLPGGGQKIAGQYFPGGGRYNGLPAGQDANAALTQLMLAQMLQQQQNQQPRLLPSGDDPDWRW